jgi:hypothetical protein
MMVIFQKNPEPNFRGPVGTFQSKFSIFQATDKYIYFYGVLNAGKRDGKKKKCAPHIPYSILELLVICVV